MNIDEKDRLVEILFYLYFDSKSAETLEKAEFWESINSICKMYNIDNIAITRAIRLLMAEQNQPQDDEMYYLLTKIGMTVRPIKRLTGIYWQKQKALEVKLSTNPIVVHRKINDVIIKRCMRDFLKALYEVFGCLINIDCETLNKIL